MAIPLLEPVEKPDVRYHSSISQHRGTFSVMKKGEWLPISFDSLDYIDCKKVVDHPAILSWGGDLGFNFGVDECVYYTDKYVYHDHKDTVVEPLQEWFGMGNYKKHIDRPAFINADNGSLGEHEEVTLRVGLSYAKADKTLEAVE